jgi:hypothetical protein
MDHRRAWQRGWTSDRRVTEADLFERDLFGPPPPRLPRVPPTLAPGYQGGPEVFAPYESPADPIPEGYTSYETPAPPTAMAPAPARAPSSAAAVVLKRVQIRLPLLGEELEVAKLFDAATDTVSTRATGRGGQPVDLPRKLAEEESARLRRYRQVHPALADALGRLPTGQRLRVVVWIYVPEDLVDKGPLLGRSPGPESPLVASSETVDRSSPRPMEPAPEPAAGDSRLTEYRRRVDAALEQATRELPAATGVQVTGRLGTVPTLLVDATAAQVRALSARPEVAGLFLHEPEGVDDLTDSMRIARATPIVAAGWKGTNIRVALWERGPDDTTNLRVEEFFDGTQTLKSSHARLTTAIVKNREAGAPHGYAPDAKVFSANAYGLDALHWAVVGKQCRVINQSFHRPSEQTTSALSVDDLVKDYLATHFPFPTIVHAAGNQTPATTEYVNHKGYNTVVVGNHDDTARNIQPSSVFRNPSSPHNDRELPDVCANGDRVSAVGVTMSGTSFASPAVAGSVALLQNAANVLLSWPEGCRAILLAAAVRNVRGRTWWDDVSRRDDGRDGAGALDAREGVRIARARAPRTAPPARRGWDVGTLHSADFDAAGKSRFRHQISVPAGSAPCPVRVALAWNSKVTYAADATATPPVKNVRSELTVDLDLQVYRGGTLVAHSSSFDNSYEVVDFQGERGATYDIIIRRWSGTDWTWYGIAWTVYD